MSMISLRRVLYSAAVAILLLPAVAAAGPFDGWYDEDTAKRKQPAGQTFHQTLFVEYRKLSDDRNRGMGDGIDAELFNHKAYLASTRTNVRIDSIHDRNITGEQRNIFRQAADRLSVVFDRGGRELAATESAVAQVAYDCWIEATERKHTSDAARCKARFDEAIAAAEAKANYQMGVVEVLPEPEPAPAPAPVVRSKPFKDYYRVRFAFDKTSIIPGDEEVLQQAIHDARVHADLKVSIRAHADRSGSDDYNLRLSRRRAEAVLARLAAAGIDQSRLYIVEAVGESRPLIPTRDGVKEQENRVVEIDLRQYD